MADIRPATGAPAATGARSLGSSLVWYVGSSAIAFLAYIGVNAMVGRLLGADDFGYFAVAFSAAAVSGEVALIGVHRAGVREAARLADGDHDGLGRLRSGVRAVAFLTLPLAGVLAALAAWWLLPHTSRGAGMLAAASVGALVVLGGHQSLWANYLRGFGHVRLAGLLEGRSGGALVASLQCVTLAVLLIWFPDIGLAGALVAVALAYVPPLLIAAYVASRRWADVPAGEGPLRALRSVIRRDWRFASARWANAISTHAELWICGWLLSSSATSLFGASARLVTLISIPLISMSTVFSPAISRMYGTGDRRRLERLLRTGGSATAAVAMVTAAPLLVAPAWVLGAVFGEAFEAASTILVLLALGAVATIVTGLTGPVLSMTHQEGFQAKMLWIGLVSRVVLGIGAAQVLGVKGLAASSALITAAVTVTAWGFIRRELDMNTAPTLRPSLRLVRAVKG